MACKQMEAMDPKHTYKYFPRQDTWTWEQEATSWNDDMGDKHEMWKQYGFEGEDWATTQDQTHLNSGHTSRGT